MRFLELVNSYDMVEATTSRISMTYYLVDLLRKTPEDIIDKVIYLTEGRLYPNFVGMNWEWLKKCEYKKRGDIGQISENLLKTRTQTTLFKRELDVKDVYEGLDKIARTSGSGSADTKIKILSGLLTDASPKEAKYIMGMITGKMRLGITDMTIIDALSQAFAGEEKMM